MRNKKMELFLEFAESLRANKESVMRSKEVLVERWDPDGFHCRGPETIEYIDFDALLLEIEHFARTLYD